MECRGTAQRQKSVSASASPTDQVLLTGLWRAENRVVLYAVYRSTCASAHYASAKPYASRDTVFTDVRTF